MGVKQEVEGMVFDSRGEGKLIGIAAKPISSRPAHLRARPISDSGPSLTNLKDATGTLFSPSESYFSTTTRKTAASAYFCPA